MPKTSVSANSHPPRAGTRWFRWLRRLSILIMLCLVGYSLWAPGLGLVLTGQHYRVKIVPGQARFDPTVVVVTDCRAGDNLVIPVAYSGHSVERTIRPGMLEFLPSGFGGEVLGIAVGDDAWTFSWDDRVRLNQHNQSHSMVMVVSLQPPPR